KGVFRIWQSLRQNSTLSHIYLDKNPLTEHGVNGITNLLSDNGCLKVLSLNECELGSGGLVTLGRMLS
ncbi:MAG: hypothetical protein V2I33_26495, partial [Kangiellaceae bacterium]|nr:hypothetical protein [Kangiellaceae bacterium]